MSDLIERETVLAFVRRCKDRLKGKGLTYEILVDYIESIPSAERKGEWIVRNNTDFYGGEECACSVCDYGYSTKAFFEPWNFKYCPHCGARMKGAEDE